MTWFPSLGYLKYGPEIKLVLAADEGIAEYYRSMVPKSITINPQRYPAHVSVVRRETPPLMSAWGVHEGAPVWFEYENIIANDEKYYWLNVRCKRLEEIRVELGLEPHPWWRNSYHLTIGNVKDSPERI